MQFLKIPTLLLASLSLSGCAAHVKPKAQVIIPRNCLTDVRLTDKTTCVWDEKEKVWHCSPLSLDYVKGCAQVSLIPTQKEKK